MIVNILREGGSNIERSGGALGHGSSLQEMRTVVGSCCPCPGCNRLVRRYGQDNDGSGGMGHLFHGQSVLGDVHYRVTYCEFRERQGRQ